VLLSGKQQPVEGEHNMKRIGFLVCLAAIMGLAAMTYADTNSSSTAHVIISVNPNVAVNTVADPAIQQVQSGAIEVVITYLVEANLQECSLFVEASDLFKGDDPTNTDVAPIPLDTTVPAVIDPANANPMNGGSPNAAWVGAGSPIGQYQTQLSETIEFESSQNNHFSQEVDVTVTWDQNDPEKPTGQYSGMVRLTALVTPV
jgi:hypothetical protein